MIKDATPEASRYLAALWFADIVGYSELVAIDEERALRLVETFQDVALRVLEREGGQLVKFIGDAALAVFPGAATAVQAGLAVRDEFRRESGGELRVGVHLGDVVRDTDGDLYGEGINIAFRLQQEAAPGQVLTSEDVWRQIRQRSAFRLESEGERNLKGTGEPIRVYSVEVRTEGPASPVRGSVRRQARWSPRLLSLVGLLVLALSGAALNTVFRSLVSPPDPGGILDPDLVAVAPFNVPGSDPELVGWGEHFVDVLTRNLDGAGPLRTVAPSTSIIGWEGRADAATAAALGRRTGAGLVVFGSLIPSGRDSARTIAAILDVESNQIVDEVAIHAADPHNRMVQVSDSLTHALLQALGRVRPIGAVRQSSLASLTSVGSLKAFLRGEQHYRRTNWDSATVYYERALEADSTFPLALRRMGLALSWQGTTEDSVVLSLQLRAGAHNRGLSPRDSLLVTADSLSAAAYLAQRGRLGGAPAHWGHVRRLFGTLDVLIQRYPRDPEAWQSLGEARYHFGWGPAAKPERDVLEAFDRAIELDPGFAPVYLHPIEIGLKTGGQGSGLGYARSYLELRPGGLQAEGVRLLVALNDGAHQPGERGRLLDAVPRAVLAAASNLADRGADSTALSVRLREVIALREGGDPDWRTTCRQSFPGLARRLAFRGRLADAICALGPAPPPTALLAEIVLLGGISADSADVLFDRWLRDGVPEATQALSWWAARGDTSRIAALLARARSRIRPGSHSPDAARAAYDAAAAMAYLTLARGDSAGALARFRELPDTACYECFRADRLTRARLHLARRQYAAASEILDAWPGPQVSPIDVLIELERGQLAETIGRRAAALRAYRYVVEVWADSDPVLDTVAHRAREGIQRVEGGPAQ